ncbi:DUF2938 domain-containing protein [Kerstersia gyiorum]|uniref:Membrane protein n=1 Tax=Kerstersia gyiorum TaxID=206506 RepID=A0A171KS45_9BURK|nr:membrane protein [Kerstersia gyiorum]
MTPLEVAWASMVTGIGATLVMDVWTLLQKRLGAPTLDYALLRRWAGYLCRYGVSHAGRQADVRQWQPLTGERSLGWLLHYAIGVVFATLLVAMAGPAWLQQPEWLPALWWGLVTVAAPFLVLQPAMGAGIASSRTATPWKNRCRSLLTHAVFGTGLYASAQILAWVQT